MNEKLSLRHLGLLIRGNQNRLKRNRETLEQMRRAVQGLAGKGSFPAKGASEKASSAITTLSS